MSKNSISDIRKKASSLGLNSSGMNRTTLEHEILKIQGKTPKRRIYTELGQLGVSGKDGIVVEVKTTSSSTYAMKKFRKNKSVSKIEAEVKFLKRGANVDISPKVREYNLVSKNIVMAKLKHNLYDLLKSKKGKLTIKIQKCIYKIFRVLDSIGVFHKDPNPLNFMYDTLDNIQIIDYGFAEDINPKNHGEFPNQDQMTLGFLLQLKQIFPDVSYTELEKHLSDDALKILDGDKISVEPASKTIKCSKK